MLHVSGLWYALFDPSRTKREWKWRFSRRTMCLWRCCCYFDWVTIWAHSFYLALFCFSFWDFSSLENFQFFCKVWYNIKIYSSAFRSGFSSIFFVAVFHVFCFVFSYFPWREMSHMCLKSHQVCSPFSVFFLRHFSPPSGFHPDLFIPKCFQFISIIHMSLWQFPECFFLDDTKGI